MIMRACIAISVLLLSGNTFGYVHDTWTDITTRSILIKCSQQAFVFPPGEYYVEYSGGVVLDDDLRAELDIVSTFGIEWCFYDYEALYGQHSGVDWSNCYLITFSDIEDLQGIIDSQLRHLSIFEYGYINSVPLGGLGCGGADSNWEFHSQWAFQPDETNGIGYCNAQDLMQIHGVHVPNPDYS